MGHSDAGGEEPHQPDADREPGQANHGRRGPQAPMDLRKLPLDGAHFFSNFKIQISRQARIIFFFFSNIFFRYCRHLATRTCGFGGAQTGDGGLPQEVQRPAQVKSMPAPSMLRLCYLIRHFCSRISGCHFDDHVGLPQFLQ